MEPRPVVKISLSAKEATKVLDVANLLALATTALADCTAIDLSGGPVTLSLTVEATYDAFATAGIRIHVRSSYDNVNYDTEDWDTWNANFVAGVTITIRQTEDYDISPYGIKVLIENLDAAQAVSNIAVYVTIGGA